MVAISSSQKKTVFAVVLIALIAVGVMISGRGGFSGLRSDVFNNPSFVCTDASLMSGEVRYNGTTATLQNLSTEKAGLQTKIQGWNADIRKNEASIKKLEREKSAAEKKERALEVAVKKQCTPRALATCAAKKQELQDIKRDIKKIRSSLTNEQNQNKSIRTNIQSAESNIKLLEKQILEIQNFKEDYETCQRALEKEKTEVASFDLIVSGEVFVNEPFDMTVRAMKSADTVNNKYEGKIFFDTNNNPADVVLPLQENDGGSEYQFQAADNGIKLFTKGLTLKKAGTYEIVVFELRGPNGGVEKKVQIVAKEKTSPVTCTDSDNGYNYFTKGQTTLSNGVVSADFCSSENTLDEYICPTTPSESGVSQSYTCPYGCNEGACKTGPYCGNGIKEGSEQCDDGNTNNNDNCNNSCEKKEDITIDITDANPLDLDKEIGNDSQTVQSGDSAEFRVRITNNGDQDIDKIFVNSTSVYSCVGSVASYSSGYSSNWKNISVTGGGNPNDTILQVGETLEYTCTDFITKGSYTPWVELQANNKYFQDTTKVITLERNKICEVMFGTKKYTLQPCSIDSTLIDGTGDKEFTFQIIPSESGVFSFTVYGYGEGFPTYGMIHSPATGGSTGVVNITSKISDSILSVNQYSGYLPIRIRQDYQSGSIEKELRLGVKLNVAEQ